MMRKILLEPTTLVVFFAEFKSKSESGQTFSSTLLLCRKLPAGHEKQDSLI